MSQLNRISKRFADLKKQNKKAFIAFATAGYPNSNVSSQLIQGMPKAGVDLIEIGMPFSDPMADGPIIQAASNEAIKGGITLPKILDMVRAFRKNDSDTPIILMGYYNPIYSYGVMRFLDDAKQAGVDGFIIPDLPPEEDEEFRAPASARDMEVIRLVTPTTNEKRLPTVLRGAGGFLYYVSITGITGSASASADSLKEHIGAIRAKSDLPISVGFGINTPQQASEMAKIADGVIMASSIIKRMGAHVDSKGDIDAAALDEVLSFISDVAEAVHGG